MSDRSTSEDAPPRKRLAGSQDKGEQSYNFPKEE